MAFSDNLGKASIDWVYLLEIEIGHRIDGDAWTQHGVSTNCWWISHAEGKPSRVEENGAEYTERASLALCNTNPSSWYWDAANNYLYVHTSGSDDPGGGSYIILSYFWERICNKQPENNEIIFTIGGIIYYYLPYLDDDDISSIVIETTEYHEGGVKQSFGSIKIINADGYFDTRLSDYIYEAKKLLWKVGKLGDAYADYATLWRGWTGSIVWSDEDIEIGIEDMRTYF